MVPTSATALSVPPHYLGAKIMNRPSSTITAAAVYGFIAATLLTTLAVFAPEYYGRIPAGFEGHLVIGVGTVAGYLKKENVLPIAKA